MNSQIIRSVCAAVLGLSALTALPGCFTTDVYKALHDAQRQQEERMRLAQDQQRRIAEEQQLMMAERRRQVEDERRRQQQNDAIFYSLPKEKQAEILLERAKMSRAQQEQSAAQMRIIMQGLNYMLSE